MANVDTGALAPLGMERKSVRDYQKEAAEFDLNRQLKKAEIKKASYLDVDKLGEAAFMKAAMGQPLSPQEEAAARFIDAKSGGTSFNPVTGEIVQKPRISEKIGLPRGLSTPQEAGINTNLSGSRGAGLSDAPIDFSPEALAPATGEEIIPDSSGFWQKQYQQELAAAQGNPKLLQTIKQKYADARLTPSEGQSNAALFANRMAESNPLIEKYSQAGMDPEQAVKGRIPLVGNFLVSKDYQSFDQARRDFINATLRRESGAVISEEEFANANRQYFPQPGDSEQVLAQKAINRENALMGIERAAGPAYERPAIQDPYSQPDVVPMPPKPAPRKGTEMGGYMFMGGDPSDQKNWKKVK